MSAPAQEPYKRIVASVYSVTLPDGSTWLARSFLVHQPDVFASVVAKGGTPLIQIWPAADRNGIGIRCAFNAQLLKATRVRTEP